MRNSAFVQYLDIANVIKTELKSVKQKIFKEKNTNLEQRKCIEALKIQLNNQQIIESERDQFKQELENLRQQKEESASRINVQEYVNQIQELKDQVIEKDKTVKMVILLLKISEAMFTFQCPVQSHWKHSSEAICDSFDKYFCLYDRNEKKYNESCRDRPDVEKPGYKLIVAGSLQGYPCDHEFYQPFKFSSIGNSRCVYKQSYCSEEGQVVYRNGTEKIVRSCRCDYTRDYECLNENEWKLNFHCDSIATVVLSKDSGISLSTDNLSFGYHVKDLKTIPIQNVEEINASLIANEKYSFKQIDENDSEKQKLKDGLSKPKDNVGNDSYHVQELQKEILQHWSNVLNKFVITKSAQLLYQKIQEQNVIAIIGPTGTGKSTCAYHVAFRLKNEYNYTIVPAGQPSDIVQYCKPGTNQVFVIDDFIGKYAFDEAEGISWEKIGPLLQKMLSNNDQTKVILTCRKSIWLPAKYERFGFSALVFDFHKKSWD
ncbi:unnamed protein product [Mytilus edulis]|uniref:Novel STAND NTPase 3 domain-containing protein n=1 Tax=Mytilus edulis TaxID=6550 RepID=A0A8S3SA93_MYTED|nr:unnamed protein product [Mytilus edulis]